MSEQVLAMVFHDSLFQALESMFLYPKNAREV